MIGPFFLIGGLQFTKLQDILSLYKTSVKELKC